MGLIRKVGGMMLAHALFAGAAIAQVPGVVAGGVPGDMDVHQRRATQYLACSQLAAAPWPKQSVARRAFLQRLETARAECLDHAEFLATLGALWLEEGEPNQALIWLERSLLLDPDSLGARADLALALAAVGQPEALAELAKAWQTRSDIPPALRSRLLPPQALKPSDPLPAVRFGAPSNGRWASFIEATVLVGYESNLDHSPKLNEITLTPPGGPIDLPLVTPLSPRRALATTADLSWQIAHSPQPGRVLRAGMHLGTREAPGESGTNWHHLQLAGSASQQWGPWRGEIELDGTWVGGPLNEPYRLTRISATGERNALGCMLRMSIEGEARYQSDTTISNGRTVGALWSSQCPLPAANGWTWGAAVRANIDRPVDPERAGGNQRLWSLGARLSGPIGGSMRLEANLRYSRIRDDDGYSALLEDNARRQLHQTQLSIELTRPVVLPGWLNAEAIAQVQGIHQRSNLAVFRYSAVSSYGGLRWSW